MEWLLSFSIECNGCNYWHHFDGESDCIAVLARVVTVLPSRKFESTLRVWSSMPPIPDRSKQNAGPEPAVQTACKLPVQRGMLRKSRRSIAALF